MLTASAELQAALLADTVLPFAKLVFTSADGNTVLDYSYDATPFRVLHIEYKEGMYADYMTVVLNNTDLAIPNLKGYWLEPGFGAYVDGTPDYVTRARMWVKEFQLYSAAGSLWAIILCEGMFEVLAEQIILRGSPPYYDTDPFTGITVKAIIEAILALMPVPITLDMPVAGDDGFVDSFMPVFEINQQPFESAQQIIYTLMKMTKCYLRPKAGLQFQLRVPTPSDEPDIVFYSSQVPYFTDYTEEQKVLKPNRWLILCNFATDHQLDQTEIDAIITGQALDAEEIAAYMDVADIDYFPTVTTQYDADKIAEAYLFKTKAEIISGVLLARCMPMVELHDNIGVLDARGFDQ